MSFENYISRNPEVMLGKPVIKGTRITVELVLDKLSSGFSVAEILEAYPHLTKDQINAAISYASAIISNETIIEV